MKMICEIDGCEKAVLARNLCCRHYNRLHRHGEPTAGLPEYTDRGEQAAYLADVILRHQGKSECLIWPYKKLVTGYARIKIDGKDRTVHRYVCEKVHGAPPSPRHEAAHECGNGHLGCVNPHHLSWKTPKENCADRIRHRIARQAA